jgi:hypothetical protein
MSDKLGVDLMVKQSDSGMGNRSKAMPRQGAARGQGAGMDGYNAGAVNKAMSEVEGGGGKPTYYCGAGMGRDKK